jgi:hypothetical protein
MRGRGEFPVYGSIALKKTFGLEFLKNIIRVIFDIKT